MGARVGLDGCEKSRPTGIRYQDRPARSESLYRLRCPGPRPTTGLDISELRSRLYNRSGSFGDMSMAQELVWTILRKQQGSIPGLGVSEKVVIHCVLLQQKSPITLTSSLWPSYCRSELT